MVRFRATVDIGFETFTAADRGCETSLEFGDGVYEFKSDRELRVKNDTEMQKFRQVVGESRDDPAHPCDRMHCMKNNVVATIEGKFEYRPTECGKAVRSRNREKCGFGPEGEWSTRILITAVSKVNASEIK